jgi:beta-lactamase superfamily II metal-dependent hydrolase
MRSLLIISIVAGCGGPSGAGPDDHEPRDSLGSVDTGSPEPAGPCEARWYPDADGDGYGDAARGVLACAAPLGWIAEGGDCDDHRDDRHPGASERCNGLDDDCDQAVDEDFPEPMKAWYPDVDADSWGRDGDRRWLCDPWAGLVDRPGDCHDGNPEVHAGGREHCDGLDNDCDGDVDEGCGGICGDGIKGGSSEACDGDDDRACPGQCSRHCACPSGSPGDLRVHMVDVGQGDAMVIISPDGFVMLLDAGPSGACDDTRAYLEGLDIRGIDYTLVSHMHSDHHGAMDSILREHPEVVAAFDNDSWFDDGSDQDYFRSTVGRRVPLQVGDRIDMGPALDLLVLHSYAGSGNENDNSVVLRLQHGAFGMLLGGDCEGACQSAIDPGPLDVYKVHHHGSSNGTSAAFLGVIQPAVALIPVGEGNSYGHPHHSTLQRLEDAGAEILRTDLHGDISLLSDGVEYELEGQRRPAWTATQE